MTVATVKLLMLWYVHVCLLLQTKQLAEEILAHIRDVAGADALVSSFTAAKKAVTAVRSERKRRAAVQVSKSIASQSSCLHHDFKSCVEPCSAKVSRLLAMKTACDQTFS